MEAGNVCVFFGGNEIGVFSICCSQAAITRSGLGWSNKYSADGMADAGMDGEMVPTATGNAPSTKCFNGVSGLLEPMP